MKRILTGIWIVLIVVLVCFIVNYSSNEAVISDYEEGNYRENNLSILGFTEPYIKPYNQGNMYYKISKYDAAIEQYQKALLLNPPHDRECKIRINLALAMVAPIDPTQVTDENLEETIDTLRSAQKVLIEHGCAHENDHEGHNEDAQKLKEDIDEFIKELQEKKNPQNNDPKPDDPPQSDPDPGDDQAKAAKQQQLIEMQKQSIKERKAQLDDYKDSLNFDFYDGATW